MESLRVFLSKMKYSSKTNKVIDGIEKDANVTSENVAPRRGATLVEVLMYLGIAAFIVGGAIILYGMADMNYKVEDVVNETLFITTKIHNLYPGSYSNLSMDTPSIVETLPSKWIMAQSNGNNPTSIFGGNMNLGGTTLNGENVFYIIYPNQPQASCIKLSTMDFGDSLVQRFPAPSGNNPGAPLTPTEAISACSQSYSNMIQFYFK